MPKEFSLSQRLCSKFVTTYKWRVVVQLFGLKYVKIKIRQNHLPSFKLHTIKGCAFNNDKNYIDIGGMKLKFR